MPVSLFEKKAKIKGKTAKMLEKDTLGKCVLLLFLVLEMIHSRLRIDQA
jgi:fumarate reductase subunit D